MKIKECMCHNVYWLKPENTVQECAKLMSDYHIGCVPVCDEEKNIVGLVTDRDVILRSIACNRDINTTPISEIMTTKVCACNSEVEIKEAEDLMCRNQIRRLPIIDYNNKIIGIISLGDLVKNNNINNKEVSDTFENICNGDHKNAE